MDRRSTWLAILGPVGVVIAIVALILAISAKNQGSSEQKVTAEVRRQAQVAVARVDDALRADVHRAAGAVNALDQRSREARRQNALLRRSTAANRGGIAANRDVIAANRAAIGRLGQRVDALAAQIGQLQGQSARLQGESGRIPGLQRQVNALKTAVHKLNANRP